MDGFTALHRANGEFERRLRRVGPDDWVRPTPCEEWDVRALVNHVVGGNRRYVLLLHGASADTVNATRIEDHLGDDPVSSFAWTAAELASALREDGAYTRRVYHPIGARTGAQLLAMRVVDVTIHTWDLARALAADDTLDPTAVEFSLTHLDVITTGREHGSFAMPTGEAAHHALLQDRLIYLAGRSPKEDQS